MVQCLCELSQVYQHSFGSSTFVRKFKQSMALKATDTTLSPLKKADLFFSGLSLLHPMQLFSTFQRFS